MLVGPGQSPSAFLPVQLRGLEARGHKASPPKRQKAPFRWTYLMLVASGQSPSAFLCTKGRNHRCLPFGLLPITPYLLRLTSRNQLGAA